MPDKKRAAIYCRVAHKDDFAIDSQEQYLREFAKTKDFEIVTVYTDNGANGITFDREGYIHLCKDAQCGDFDVLIVRNHNRISRDYTRLPALIEWFEKYNVTLISTDAGDNDISFLLSNVTSFFRTTV